MKIRNILILTGLLLTALGLRISQAAEPLFSYTNVTANVMTGTYYYAWYFGASDYAAEPNSEDFYAAQDDLTLQYDLEHPWGQVDPLAVSPAAGDMWDWYDPYLGWFDASLDYLEVNLTIDLTACTNTVYTNAFLEWPIVKYHCYREQGSPYVTNEIGGQLTLGTITNVHRVFDIPFPPWSSFDSELEQAVELWDVDGTLIGGEHFSVPRVWLTILNWEALFEKIRPEAPTVGDPVNTINGNVQLDATDIALPAPGFPLVFSRSYNSVLDYSGSLGHRWTHSYNWFLSDTNTVFGSTTNTWKVLQTGEGRQFYFKSLGSGVFESPIDNNWRLADSGTNSYTLTLPEGTTCTFDSNGVLQALADLQDNTVTLTYSNSYPAQLLTRIDHSSGRYVECTYSGSLMNQVKSPSANLYVNFSYNAQDELTNATRVVGATSYPTTYAYDYDVSWCNHSLTQRVNAAGDVFSWEYDTDSSGHVTSKSVRSTVSSNLFETALGYATNGENRTTVTFTRNQTDLAYEYYFNPVLQRITEIRGPNPDFTNWATTGTGTWRGYDDRGNATNEIVYDYTVSEQYQTLLSYDANHNVTNEAFGYCAAPANPWAYTWNTNLNLLTGVIDPEGHKTEIEYSDALPVSTKLYYSTEDYWETLMGYTSSGLLSGVTNANGHWVNYYHDSYGNVTSTVPQVGPAVLATYTSLGHLQTIQMPPYAYFPDTSDPGSTNGIWMYRVTSNTVNELGWVSKTTYPHPDTGGTNGPSEHFYRDALGNVTNHVDIAGRSTKYTWLPTRKLSSVIQTLNGTNVSTSLTYDNQFNTLVIQDTLGRTVESYALDLQDRPVTVTNLEGQTMTVDYGVGNFVRSISRFDGTTVDNSYNSDGLLEYVDYPDDTISMTYLKNGLLSTMDNSLGVVSNSWTFANRLSSQTQVAPSGTVSYAQDPVGNVTGMTSVAGTQVNAFDEGERVSSIQSESFFQFAYNTNNGLLSSVVCTNSGIGVNYTMDAWDRVKNITWTNDSGETLRSFTYAYNSTGVISSVTHEDGSVVVYGYDGIDRLTGETQVDAQGNTNLDVSLTYDLAGNRTSKTRDGVEIVYSLGDGNRLSGWSTVDTNFSVTLDVSGYADEDIGTGERYGQLWVSNSLGTMTPYVNGEYFYAFGMLSALGTQELVAAICDLAGNTTYATSSVCMSVVTNGNYQYNDAGCVTSMVYTGIAYSRSLELSWNSQYQLTSASTNGAEVESYGYDALARRVYIAQGATTNWLVYDGVQVVAEVNGNGQLQRSYTWGPGIDNLLAMTVYSGGTGTTFYALTDNLGSIHAFADLSGSIVESYRWDAWGRLLGVYGSDGQPISESAIGNRYLWQGREYSWTTGLYYFRARWYDPVTGRFMGKDPFGISAGVNQYVAFENCPVTFVDPSGLDAYVDVDEKKGTINIRIPIKWWGDGMTDRIVGIYTKAIEDKWKGTYGKWTLHTTVVPPQEGGLVNIIEIKNGDGQSYMDPGKNTGIFYAGDETCAAHEAGHMLGLHEKYYNEFHVKSMGISSKLVGYPFQDPKLGNWKGNIMAESGGNVDIRNIEGAEPLIGDGKLLGILDVVKDGKIIRGHE